MTLALPDALKESNRQQAADIGRKLRSMGCSIRPLTDWDAEVGFTAGELERLARSEHERWVGERRARGWRPGPVKDVQRRRSPYLVPWEELPAAQQELNRATVREIPQYLAEAGFAVVRSAPLEEAGPAASATSYSAH